MLAKPDTTMTGGMVELSAIPALSAISTPGSATAIPLDIKRQRSATNVEAPFSDSIDYLVSKLSKFTCTNDKVNTSLGKDIRAMVKKDNTNSEAIMLQILATIAGSLHSL